MRAWFEILLMLIAIGLVFFAVIGTLMVIYSDWSSSWIYLICLTTGSLLAIAIIRHSSVKK